MKNRVHGPCALCASTFCLDVEIHVVSVTTMLKTSSLRDSNDGQRLICTALH
jgi:hypothetical protein